MTNTIYSNNFEFYIVYETTCNINGMTYIGCHATNNLEDGYLGSGRHLTRAIKKYGKQAFSRSIIQFFNNPEEMFNIESSLVTEEYVNNKNTYNLVVGGFGGFKVQNIEEWKHKLKESSAKRENKKPMLGKNHTNETRQKMSDSNKGRIPWNLGKPGTWIGRTHSEESKRLISLNRTRLTSGENNPMFGKSAVKGRKWFNNEINTFYLFPNDPKISELNLKMGRLPKQAS